MLILWWLIDLVSMIFSSLFLHLLMLKMLLHYSSSIWSSIMDFQGPLLVIEMQGSREDLEGVVQAHGD